MVLFKGLKFHLQLRGQLGIFTPFPFHLCRVLNLMEPVIPVYPFMAEAGILIKSTFYLIDSGFRRNDDLWPELVSWASAISGSYRES